MLCVCEHEGSGESAICADSPEHSLLEMQYVSKSHMLAYLQVTTLLMRPLAIFKHSLNA